MENTVASQEFVILALGLLLSFIVAASIAFTPIKEDEKEEELKFTVTVEPPRTDFNETLETIAKLKELDEQGLLKRYEPYKPKTTRPRYTSNNNSDPYYVKVNNDYYNDNTDYYSDHASSHDCSSHDCSSHNDTSYDGGSDCGGGD